MHYIAESSYGVTPATPTMAALRHTGTTLAVNKSTHISDELRADRQIADFRHGAKQVGGDVNFELSYSSLDAFIEAALGGTWGAKTAPYVASTIAAAASDNSLNDSADGFPATIEAGDKIAVSGFTGDVGNNVAIATVVSNDGSKMVLSGVTLVDDIEGEAVTITSLSQVLKAGTTRRSFSILRNFPELATGDYHLFTGCEVNTMNLSIPTDDKVTGSFGMLGKGLTVGDSAPAGSTLSSPNTNRIIDSFSGSVKEGGSAISIVTEINLTLDNGLTSRMAVGSDEVISEAKVGRSNVNGSATFYFESETQLNKFLAETQSSLQFTLVDPDGNQYVFLVPKLTYNGGQPDTGGASNDIVLEMPWQGVYDATTATNLMITRHPVAA